MPHRHDSQPRLSTKHPGSKRGHRPVPPFGCGNRVYQKHNPENTGTVVHINTVTGAFTVRYDEKATTGERKFIYPSYLAHNFILGNPPEIRAS
jgi:hypothetical protein